MIYIITLEYKYISKFNVSEHISIILIPVFRVTLLSCTASLKLIAYIVNFRE